MSISSTNRLRNLVIFMFLFILLSGCDGKVNEEKLEESKDSIESALENNEDVAPYIKDVKWDFISNEFTYKNNIEFLEYGHYYYRLTINIDNNLYKQNQEETNSLVSGSLHANIRGALLTSEFFRMEYGEEPEDYVITCGGWSTTCNVELVIEDATSPDSDSL